MLQHREQLDLMVLYTGFLNKKPDGLVLGEEACSYEQFLNNSQLPEAFKKDLDLYIRSMSKAVELRESFGNLRQQSLAALREGVNPVEVISGLRSSLGLSAELIEAMGNIQKSTNSLYASRGLQNSGHEPYKLLPALALQDARLDQQVVTAEITNLKNFPEYNGFTVVVLGQINVGTEAQPEIRERVQFMVGGKVLERNIPQECLTHRHAWLEINEAAAKSSEDREIIDLTKPHDSHEAAAAEARGPQGATKASTAEQSAAFKSNADAQASAPSLAEPAAAAALDADAASLPREEGA